MIYVFIMTIVLFGCVYRPPIPDPPSVGERLWRQVQEICEQPGPYCDKAMAIMQQWLDQDQAFLDRQATIIQQMRPIQPPINLWQSLPSYQGYPQTIPRQGFTCQQYGQMTQCY